MHLSVPGPSVYITMLRDPVRRVVSTYHYIRRQQGHPLHRSFSDPAMPLERALDSGLIQMFDNGQTRALSGMDAADERNSKPWLAACSIGQKAQGTRLKLPSPRSSGPMPCTW